MARRTFVIGDIHGDLDQLFTLLRRMPRLDATDKLVFLGDYVDRGPESSMVVEFVRKVLPDQTPADVIALRGNHEDAWLRVHDKGFPEFIMPPTNGALACMRSYTGAPLPMPDEQPRPEEYDELFSASFFPPEHIEWFRSLPYFYEDEHAIYVHAGLPKKGNEFLHPSKVNPPTALLWLRTESFFRDYRGKRVVVGHTTTDCLPPELSSFTPDDPMDLWAGEAVTALDTGCGKGGFLTGFELPGLRVYESR